MKIRMITLVAVLLLPFIVGASVSSGTIESGNSTTLVCHSVDCITPNPGIINFIPTGTTPVTIDDTNGVDGVAWGNEIGWINFDPTGVEGLTINSSTGIISGKAWSQVSGWINFSVTGQSVKINTAGEFEGYAWTGGPYGGWIKFDCSFVGACVKTDWRPLSARPVTGTPTAGSGGSTSQNDISNLNTNDFCLNIPGYQDRIPDNYAQDPGGLCLLNIDYCKNISGIQLTIPNAYVLNGSGQCILLTDENQDEFIPTKESLSTSTESQSDFCQNLFGIQPNLPNGFAMYNNECVPEESDYCPNFLGNQYGIPENMKISENGECVKMTRDEIEKKEIFKNKFEKYDKNSNVRVLGYGFMPDFFRIPVTIPFFSKLFGKEYQIDLLSLFFTLNVIGLVSLFIKNRTKNN